MASVYVTKRDEILHTVECHSLMDGERDDRTKRHRGSKVVNQPTSHPLNAEIFLKVYFVQKL